MSRNPLRKDKTCLNCKHVVENRFCPNCGQENSDTRKTFQHLFIHFFEDLTHYENAFWRTIKNLLFRPSSLTKEYLSGKRLSYLAPVRLYIFISFITFFLIAVIPDSEDKLLSIKQTKTSSHTENNKIKIDAVSERKIGIKELLKQKSDTIVNDSLDQKVPKKPSLTKEEKEIEELLKTSKISKSTKDTLMKIIKKSNSFNNSEKKGYMNFRNFRNSKQLDSLKKFGKGENEINDFEYWFFRKALKVKENNTKEEMIEKLIESSKHNFPKVLLIYMPFFAFFLWVFHNKKRWYYFDHGIFTLHYFSFLLLLFLIVFLSSSLLDLLIKNKLITIITKGIEVIGYGWMFYYFFPAHHRFYGETRWVSFIKSFALFIINMFFITILLTLFFLYTLINIH